MIPREISHYRIIQKLGEGGMGEVYLGEDAVLGRRVALKVLPANVTSDAKRIGRFEREARTISALNHPNILTIHELGSEAGLQFIVTEYIEGQTLRERMRSRVSVGEALDIVSAVATGLAAAHRAGIIHRDLKPENVMIRSDGLVKLLDFGVASLTERMTSPSDDAVTGEHEIVGTLPYMSPEQLRAKNVDARSDVFSLAVMLFEVLAGRRPFVATTSVDLIAAILNQEPPRLSRFVVDVPAALDDLIAAMLAKDPDHRPDTLAEVISRVAEVRRSLDRAPVSLPQRVVEERRETPPETNLPAELAPLIDREMEVDQLRRLLSDSGVRLVTLTGPGGTGKTRLAVAAAFRAREYFPDGVFFVSLASVSTAALVVPTIAQALGVKEIRDESLVGAIQRRLSGREVLIVVDNFEHLVQAAHVVTELLSAAPKLKVLITSQTALRARGEREFPVTPLPVPTRHEPAAALHGNPAVALFVARAREVNPVFELTDDNAAAVLGICRRLDGLPLAIELAAARVKVMSPGAILQKLDEPLAFLRGGPRDLPPRQQTMRNAIEWSYSLLTSDEQILFRRLAIFHGGCTSESVQQVCALGLDHERILDDFSALVDKSLCHREPDSGQEPRFVMLRTIQGFAADLLAAAPERTDLQREHAAYFLRLAERAEPELYSPTAAIWLSALDRDLHNIRSAVSWSLRTGEIDVGLRLTTALLPFWLRRAHLSEGFDQLKRLLAAADGCGEEQRLRALHALGVLAEAQGKDAEASRYFEQSLQIYRGRGDRWGIANALNNLGVMSLRQDDLLAARALYQESLAIWRAVGNRAAVALSLQNLGNVARFEKRFEAARLLYDESLAEFRALRDDLGVGTCLNLLADLAREEGDLEEARKLGEESLQIFMRLTNHPLVAVSLTDLGRVEQESLRWSEAHALYLEALLIYRELGDRVAASRVLDFLATLAIERNHAEEAIRLAAAAMGLRKSAGVRLNGRDRLNLEKLLAHARAAAGPLRATELWREGESLSLDDAVALAEQQQFG